MLATTFGGWRELTPALASALLYMEWTVEVNRVSVLATRWPQVDPESWYTGVVHLKPQTGPLPGDTIWTDGFVRVHGGATFQMTEFHPV